MVISCSGTLLRNLEISLSPHSPHSAYYINLSGFSDTISHFLIMSPTEIFLVQALVIALLDYCGIFSAGLFLPSVLQASDLSFRLLSLLSNKMQISSCTVAAFFDPSEVVCCWKRCFSVCALRNPWVNMVTLRCCE